MPHIRIDSGSDDESSFEDVGEVRELVCDDGLGSLTVMAKFISEWPS